MTGKRTDPTSQSRGNQAEQTARVFLTRRGLRVVERNYRAPCGEIDLVMDDRGTLVFVEVRYRNSVRFGGAAESVDARKQARLRATAEHYLQKYKKTGKKPCRFDIVAIGPGTGDIEVQWLRDAF